MDNSSMCTNGTRYDVCGRPFLSNPGSRKDVASAVSFSRLALQIFIPSTTLISIIGNIWSICLIYKEGSVATSTVTGKSNRILVSRRIFLYSLFATNLIYSVCKCFIWASREVRTVAYPEPIPLLTSLEPALGFAQNALSSFSLLHGFVIIVACFGVAIIASAVNLVIDYRQLETGHNGTYGDTDQDQSVTTFIRIWEFVCANVQVVMGLTSMIYMVRTNIKIYRALRKIRRNPPCYFPRIRQYNSAPHGPIPRTIQSSRSILFLSTLRFAFVGLFDLNQAISLIVSSSPICLVKIDISYVFYVSTFQDIVHVLYASLCFSFYLWGRVQQARVSTYRRQTGRTAGGWRKPATATLTSTTQEVWIPLHRATV